MKIQTGKAVLKISCDGEKYWKMSDDSSKDPSIFPSGKCIELNPEAFDKDAEIIIMEEFN